MRKLVVILSAISIGQLTFAEQHSSRQREAHVHGAAELNLVLENQQLIIEFESPAINIVGFEHKPGNTEQEQTVHSAKKTLKNAAQLFGLPEDAGCRLITAEVEWSMEEHHDEEHHDEEHHDEEHHDEEHHDEDHHDKEHHKDNEEHEEETHSEFHASYAFKCASPDQLNSIDVLLFEHFPNTQEIDAKIIGPDGQTALELSANANRIEL